MSVSGLKAELKFLESIFDKDHERFRIVSWKLDELHCQFVLLPPPPGSGHLPRCCQAPATFRAAGWSWPPTALPSGPSPTSTTGSGPLSPPAPLPDPGHLPRRRLVLATYSAAVGPLPCFNHGIRHLRRPPPPPKPVAAQPLPL